MAGPDLDALAKKHGGSLDDLAAKFGGTSTSTKPAEPAPIDPLASHMGSRPSGGYTVSEDSADHPIMDALSSAAHPKDLGDFLGLLIPSAVGMASHAATKLSNSASQAMSPKAHLTAYATAAQKAYQRTGSLKSVPLGMLKELYWSAFGKAANGARLVRDPTNEFVVALNELRQSGEPAAEAVGTIAGKVSTGVNVNPTTVSTRSGPMTATLPDKHNLTAILPQGDARILNSPNSAFTANKPVTIENIIARVKELDAGAPRGSALTADHVALAKAAVMQRVMTPANAAQLISKGDPTKFTDLMRILLKVKQ